MTQYLQFINLPKEVNANKLHERVSAAAPINDLILLTHGSDENDERPVIALIYAQSEQAAAEIRSQFSNFLFAGKPLIIEDATPEQIARLEAPTRRVAREVGAVLGEVLPKPIRQLEEIAELCGVEFMQSLMQETMDIQASGGMPTKDGSRQRTLGGVFFYLAASRVTPEIRKTIFGSSGTGPKEPSQPKAPKPPPTPPLIWAERMEVLRDILDEAGEATNLKVTLIGRPGRIQERRDVVITTMQYRLNKLQLPKGVPEPPKEPTTVAVFIGAKQWRRVAEAIQDPHDQLIIEGHSVFDAELKGLAVFATNVTTKNLQRARREEQKAQEAAQGEETAPPNRVTAAAPGAQRVAAPPARPSVQSAPRSTQTAPQTPPAQAKKAVGDVATRLAELHELEDAARRELEQIKALPPDEQVGFAQALNKLQRIKAEIRQLQQE